MRISAYAIAIGVKQRRYPWEAAILSALSVADELCICYDKRFDDPDIFTAVDSRVKPVEWEYDFHEWDFINNALSAARGHCTGQWCLLTEMDLVLNDVACERIPQAIERADREGHEAVKVRFFSSIHDLVDVDKFNQWPSRQSLTRNVSYIYHKTSDYMIRQIDSDIWDGKCIGSYAFDDFSYYDERTKAWFNDADACFVENDYSENIESAIKDFTHFFHYSGFNMGRRNAQGRQASIWQDRTYGRATELDAVEQVRLLKETVVIEPAASQEAYDYFVAQGRAPAKICHPSWAREWVDGMGVDAT